MAPEIQAVAQATRTWLQTSWNIQVPSAWLEACVDWLQEEAGGHGRLLQQQVNQQALDQWLLTDLRDLAHPVLPEGLSGAQKTELRGTFCIQVDSVLDISQPAYGQLQKLKGTDVSNDEVSAVTQVTQRPWEAKPSRMLLLQVTDGIQSLEAMEYKPVPALTAALRPGVKLQLQGQMVCRLGMLLLGPSNVKVLGGEVEDLVERNSGGRVLCRALGLPEEEERQQPEEDEVSPTAQQGNQELDEQGLDDAELLASLEAQDEVDRMEPGRDSGYWTLSNTTTQSTRSSSTRSLISTASSRSEVSAVSLDHHSGHNNRDASFQGPPNSPQQARLVAQFSNHINDHNMEDDHFPDDFDDLPLDELDAVVFQESQTVAGGNRQRSDGVPGVHSGAGHVSLLGSTPAAQKRDHQGCAKVTPQRSTSSAFTSPAPQSPPRSEFITNDEDELMAEDMDLFFVEEKVHAGASQPAARQGSSADVSLRQPESNSSRGASNYSTLSGKEDPRDPASALTLTSPPFTYLRLLEEATSKLGFVSMEIRLKAFIMTLLGKLSSSGGSWSIAATISDGTGYMDVELSDGVLAGLLGFSVAEKEALKRQPARREELSTGMRRCQEELVDMCCIMTVLVKPGGGKAVVTKAEPVSEKTLGELERRVRDGKGDQRHN